MFTCQVQVKAFDDLFADVLNAIVDERE